MEREVRYCTTDDGVRIAYRVEGEGPPLLVVPLFIGSFSLFHLVPLLEDFMRQIGRGRQLIHYDVRGTGLSQQEVNDLSPAATLLDVEAVVRSLELKRFSLWGMAIGGPRAIEYAASHPRQVDKLILSGTFARLLDVFAREALQGFAQLARANWEVVSRTFADLGIRRHDEQEGLSWAEWYRKSITGETMAGFIDRHVELDVTHLLPRVKCPTLVLHFLSDPLYPFALGQRLAQAIPQASLVPLEGYLSGVSGYTQAEIDATQAFLSESRGPAVAKPTEALPAFRTVLFTDVVAHTEMMQRLGDERGREVLREHERITREVLKAHGGTEVKTMGDGFMASFASVTKAVECAIALQRGFEEWNAGVGASFPGRTPLNVRVGLNAGEPIEEEGDLFGATVILASRIAAQAEGGEVLASVAVRELCAGKGFLFADRGESVLRGFEDPVRMFEIRWSFDSSSAGATGG